MSCRYVSLMHHDAKTSLCCATTMSNMQALDASPIKAKLIVQHAQCASKGYFSTTARTRLLSPLRSCGMHVCRSAMLLTSCSCDCRKAFPSQCC